MPDTTARQQSAGFSVDAAFDIGTNESGEYTKFSDKLTDSLDDITRMLNEHKAMIDAIQDVGIQLTSSFGSLHKVTVKYAGIVNGALDLMLPWLKKLPLVPPRFVEVGTALERITQKIIDSSVETAKAITDVNTGLKTGDVQRLQGHSSELKKVTQLLSAIVPDND